MIVIIKSKPFNANRQDGFLNILTLPFDFMI